MVMGLCLLVYNLGQRSLRIALQAAEQTNSQSIRQTYFYFLH